MEYKKGTQVYHYKLGKKETFKVIADLGEKVKIQDKNGIVLTVPKQALRPYHEPAQKH